MRIVAKNKPGQPHRLIGKLSCVECEIIRRYWIGAYTQDEDPGHALATYAALVQRIKQLNGWLACDCCGEDSDTPPILAPREYAPGRFTLQRESSRPHHKHGCVFFWGEGDLSGRNGRQEQPKHLNDTPPDWILFRTNKATASEHQDEPDGAGSSQGERRPALQTRLMWLLREARLNHLDGFDPSHKTESLPPLQTELSDLRKSAERILLMGEITLTDILWTRPSWIYKGWAAKDLPKLLDRGWPRDIPLQGYLLVAARNIEGNAIDTVEGTRLVVSTPVTMPSREGYSIRAPYVVIASVKYDDATHTCELPTAYAHPRMTHGLFPVDSNNEREAAELLKWVARRVKQESGFNLDIEKPLFDLHPEQGMEAVRPDFLVHANGLTLVIETMGSNDPEYRERKARTQEGMKRLGPLFLDERATSNHKQANRRLSRYVFGWLRAIGVMTGAALEKEAHA